ncbi:Mth938-like domain-containing protein [Pikeienuella sp. HZG-20]|uniref:Mth938-like domain-containing protein n=1 Tax=Paludibacillus litoralis TaxID=3133267 RepID=UPI0030EEB7BF
MRISELSWDGPPPIDSYGGGGFRVSGVFRAGGLLLTPGGMAGWPAAAPFSPEDFAPVIAEAAETDVLLVGMGREIAPLPAPVRLALEAAGIGAEVMATGAACRTYNVLLSEGRRVAAALVAV